jgi:hypothetical protein
MCLTLIELCLYEFEVPIFNYSKGMLIHFPKFLAWMPKEEFAKSRGRYPFYAWMSKGEKCWENKVLRVSNVGKIKF